MRTSSEPLPSDFKSATRYSRGPRLECASVRELPITELLDRAAAGDRYAWDAIVDRYCRLVWSVVRSFRLDDAAAADVTQTVWLRLVEHCGRIRDPERLPGWLATTARNESLRVLKGQRRQTPSDFEFDVWDSTIPEVDEHVMEDEVQLAMRRAFAQLPADARQLMSLLCTDPPLDYATISELVGRPVGSIGPTRQRILDKLRALVAAELGDVQGEMT